MPPQGTIQALGQSSALGQGQAGQRGDRPASARHCPHCGEYVARGRASCANHQRGLFEWGARAARIEARVAQLFAGMNAHKMEDDG